ncbi:MAG: hypothetical protein IJ489_10215 [Clostridia bacterium]|nr:hypothetical protein [Clostridia bacterium]
MDTITIDDMKYQIKGNWFVGEKKVRTDHCGSFIIQINISLTGGQTIAIKGVVHPALSMVGARFFSDMNHAQNIIKEYFEKIDKIDKEIDKLLSAQSDNKKPKTMDEL